MPQEPASTETPLSALEQMRAIVNEVGYPAELSVSSGGISIGGDWYFRLVYVNDRDNIDTYMTGYSSVSALEALKNAAQQLLELHQ